MPVVISGVLDLEDPSKREQMLKEAKPFIDGALSQEGAIAYAWTIDPHVEGRIHVFEEWTSSEALINHLANHHYTDMRDHMGGFGLKNAVTQKYRVDLIEPVYDETFTPRGDFFTAKD